MSDSQNDSMRFVHGGRDTIVERGKDMRKKSVLSAGVAVGLMAMSGAAVGNEASVGVLARSGFFASYNGPASAVQGVVTAKGGASFNRSGPEGCGFGCDPWSYRSATELYSVDDLSDPSTGFAFNGFTTCGLLYPLCVNPSVGVGVGANGGVSPTGLNVTSGITGGRSNYVVCTQTGPIQCSTWGESRACIGASQTWTVDPLAQGDQVIFVTGYLIVEVGATAGTPSEPDPPCWPHQSSASLESAVVQRVVIQGPGTNLEYPIRIVGEAGASKGFRAVNVVPDGPESGESGRIDAQFTVTTSEAPDESCAYAEIEYTIEITVRAGEAWTVSLVDATSGLTDLIGDVSGAGLDTCGFGCGDVGSQSDGRVDYADLRAILRSIGSSTNDCNYILSIDRNEDGFISETEALSFVCNGLADFNQDGSIDFFDFDDFMAAFDVADCAADATGDGFVDFFDLDAFLAAFESETACGDIPFC